MSMKQPLVIDDANWPKLQPNQPLLGKSHREIFTPNAESAGNTRSPMARLGRVCFSVNLVACLVVALASGDVALAQAKRPGAQPLAVIELGKLPQAPLYWHLDTYPTRAAAEAAKGVRRHRGRGFRPCVAVDLGRRGMAALRRRPYCHHWPAPARRERRERDRDLLASRHVTRLSNRCPPTCRTRGAVHPLGRGVRRDPPGQTGRTRGRRTAPDRGRPADATHQHRHRDSPLDRARGSRRDPILEGSRQRLDAKGIVRR